MSTSKVLRKEKFKCRTVLVRTKLERINVGDEKDHFVAVGEGKGLISNMEGKTFGEGWVAWGGYIVDFSPKTVSDNGYGTMTDKDGHKIFWKYERMPNAVYQWTFFKGTGKFEGVKGKGTSSWVRTVDQEVSIANWEGEVELPR